MLQGFNHNVRHRGRLFHVQTEDSGLASPHIITLLYHGGTIVSSKRISYADILTSDRRDEVVCEIMREQHRQMLRELREGRLDALLTARGLTPIDEAAPGGGAGALADDLRNLDDILLDHLASRVTEPKPRR